MLRGELPSTIPKRFGDRMDAAFALNRFEQDGANRVVELGFKVVHVIEADKIDARQQRSEREAIFFRGSDADGAERSTVERVVHRKDAMLLSSTRWEVGWIASVETRELQRGFDSFRTAVGEKNAIHPGPLGKLLRQRALKRVVIQIRE